MRILLLPLLPPTAARSRSYMACTRLLLLLLVMPTMLQ